MALEAQDRSRLRSGITSTIAQPASATGWPWLFRATQRLILSESGLSVTLTVENLSDDVMPAGMGLHPHFPFASDMRVSMAATDRVVMTDDMLPDNRAAGRSRVRQTLWQNRPWLSRFG